MIISKLPSTQGKSIECGGDSSKSGLRICSWEGGLLPSPGGKPRAAAADHWFKANVSRTGETSARISVQGRNTRSCRVYLDSHNISRFVVHGSGHGDMLPGYGIKEKGINQVSLWSRTWGRKFIVDVEWKGTDDSSDSPVKGRVACEWVEYESGSVGLGSGGKIPAFEEVLTYMPKWATPTKRTDGLVEAWGNFVI